MENYQIPLIQQAQRMPGVKLWHTSKLWQYSLNIALKPVRLSFTNAAILINILHLSFENKQANQSIVAQLSGVDLMTTSQALRTLEHKGFIIRKSSSTDKRAYILNLTTKGKKTAYKALALVTQTHQEFFAILEEAEEVTIFTNILNQLIESAQRKLQQKGDVI